MEEYCDDQKLVEKKDRQVLILRDPILCSLRKTKERIKEKGRLTKETRDNLQDMIYPYLTYQFQIVKRKRSIFYSEMF